LPGAFGPTGLALSHRRTIPERSRSMSPSAVAGREGQRSRAEVRGVRLHVVDRLRIGSSTRARSRSLRFPVATPPCPARDRGLDPIGPMVCGPSTASERRQRKGRDARGHAPRDSSVLGTATGHFAYSTARVSRITVT
jgi:hypothetical protein